LKVGDKLQSYYCQAQFSFIITLQPATQPPSHPVKVSKWLSTAAGKLKMEDDLNVL
jgi:hypothetical protein